jgi:hypothetical protein
MSLAVNKRSTLIVQSEIRNIALLNTIGGYDLSQMVCAWSSFAAKNGAKETLDKGLNHILDAGINELRRSITKKMKKNNNIQAHPDKIQMFSNR